MAVNHIEDGFSGFPDVSIINGIPRPVQASSEVSEQLRAVQHGSFEIPQEKVLISPIRSKTRIAPKIPQLLCENPQNLRRNLGRTVINGEGTIFTTQDSCTLSYLARGSAGATSGKVGLQNEESFNAPIIISPNSTGKGEASTGLARRSSCVDEEVDSNSEPVSTRPSSKDVSVMDVESSVFSTSPKSKLDTFQIEVKSKDVKDHDCPEYNHQSQDDRLYSDIRSPLLDFSNAKENYISSSISDEDLLDLDPTGSEKHNISKSTDCCDDQGTDIAKCNTLPLEDPLPRIQGWMNLTGALLEHQPDMAPNTAASSCAYYLGILGQAAHDYDRCFRDRTIKLATAEQNSNFKSKARLYSKLPLMPVPKHPKPFVRPAFPNRLCARSCITAATPSSVLRTCFRIGEAIRAGSEALRSGSDAIIELYARVTYSSRIAPDGKQHFQFADLFHEHPPFLNGIHDTRKGKRLWDEDYAAFLPPNGSGRKARIIGRLKWQKYAIEDKPGWKLTILSIWEAEWDDIEHVKGIVCDDVCPNRATSFL